jgi:predicted enzyme related to lactoylglutathione lyase
LSVMLMRQPVHSKGGGRVVRGPFDIEVGRCVVVEDPWGNRLVLLDLGRGPLTDAAAL